MRFLKRMMRTGFVSLAVGSLACLCFSMNSSAQLIPAPGMDALGENQYPNQQYYVGLELYREGALSDASAAFGEALRQTRRDPNGRWIDAIPVHAMLGECFYQVGDLSAAIEQFDAALSLAIRHRGWINRIQWETAIKAGEIQPSPAASWAGKATPTLVPFSQSLQLATGSNNLEASYDRGSFESARVTLVDANEILKGLSISLYRRGIIFGPLAADFDIGRNALAAIEYPTNPNGRSVVGCVRACGYFASRNDKDALAESVTSSTMAGRVHALTPLSLITAARVLASRDNFSEAVPVALQAAAAASAVNQPEWACEAMLVLAGCITAENAQTVQANSIAMASSHLRRGRIATLGALLAGTEAALARNDVNTAGTVVGQAATLLQNREVFVPRVAAACDLLVARVAAARGGSLGGNAAIDESVSRAIGFANGQGYGLDGKRRVQRGGAIMFSTPRLFQLGLVGIETSGRGIGGRAVDERLEQFVSDRAPGLLPDQVWRADHLDALAYESFDLTNAMTAYLISTWKRNPPLDVLVQSDALMRRRFLATLPIGGRLQQTRRLAATERDLLVESAAAVLVKPPARLARMLAILSTPPSPYGSPELLARGNELESLTTQLALDRGNIPATMPPPIIGQSDLDKLQKGTGLLTFVSVGEAMIGTLTLNGNVKTWSTETPRSITIEISRLLRGMGAIVSRGSTRIDSAEGWRSNSAALRSMLIPDDVYATMRNAERVIVVPDGPLWYLPFELLGFDDSATALWADRFVVTYAPTPGLALHNVAQNRLDRPTGVFSSLFFSPRDAELNANHLATVTQSLQLMQTLPSNPPVATSALGESIGRLVVFGVVTPNLSDPSLTTPGLYDAANSDGTIASWLRFPSLVPTQVILPGFRTAGANANLGDGREISWLLTAMHCCGVRNIVLSRWPVGGESTSLLLKEFLQELPYDDTHRAWHRAVASIRNTPLDPASEPLLSGKDAAIDNLTGSSPLFWAGYLLDASGPE